MSNAHSLVNQVKTHINKQKPQSRFKTKHHFLKRTSEATRILGKFPDRIPIIVEKDPRCKDIPDIDRKKYLVPSDLTMANFMYVIRRRIKLIPEKSLYLFVDETNMVASSQLISSVYADFASPDKFLYILYAGESTFG